MWTTLAAAVLGLVCASVVFAQDSHPTFTVGTAVAQRGQKAFGAIAVPKGSDAGYDIPVAVVHGARPGPVLAIVAGSHGTEYASIIAVQQLIDLAQPRAMAGTLILVPLVNVASFEQITPHLNPVDSKNMNRMYPGSATGTQTERASYAITKAVIEPCDHLIDLHGGDLDENLRPYSYWSVTGNARQDDVSKAMVLAFGLEHIIVSRDRPRDPNASRFLENTATTRGKPSFTAEAGRSGPVDAADVKALTDGCQRVMQYLKMLPAPTPNAKAIAPVWIENLVSMTADAPGVFLPSAQPGARVTKGDRIGTVTDYLHQHARDVVASESGMIMFIRALPSLRKGDTIANIGVIK
jgi:hypothetical protein